jgi:hypothetical protein
MPTTVLSERVARWIEVVVRRERGPVAAAAPAAGATDPPASPTTSAALTDKPVIELAVADATEEG